MSADLTRFLTVLLWAGVAWAFLAIAVGVVRTHLAEVRRTLDHLTWGDPADERRRAELFAKGLSECPHCGKDDCWCDRDGEGWRDLMDAARDEEHDFDAWEQEVTR